MPQWRKSLEIAFVLASLIVLKNKKLIFALGHCPIVPYN